MFSSLNPPAENNTVKSENLNSSNYLLKETMRNMEKSVVFWTMDINTGKILTCSNGIEKVYGISVSMLMENPFSVTKCQNLPI